MKQTLRMIFAAMVLGFCSLATGAAQNPVVVELFTSEGCSSCPPADAVLVELSHQVSQDGRPLILLGEHVDYWNYIGWTDRFSSPQFSQRQSDYARAFHLGSVYTPQMVIDGRLQFVGNDPAEVHRKIEEAAKETEPVQVALQWEGKSRLHVTGHSATVLQARVLLAITEDGLSTSVDGGENGGRTLHHAAVVRELRELGSMDRGRFESSVDVLRQTGWNGDQLKVAILVQDPHTKKILGAASIDYQH